MSDLMLNFIMVDVICVTALIILALSSLQNVLFRADMKKYFALAAVLAGTVILAEVGSIIFENIRRCRIPVLVSNTVGFSLAPFIPIVLARAFSVGKGNIIRTLLAVPAWGNAVLVMSSPWTGFIFSVSRDVQYMRGPLFSVFIAAYFSACSVLVMDSVRAMRHYQCHHKSTFIFLLFFTIGGTAVQLIWPHIHAAWLCVTLSLILFYAYFCVLTETQDTLTGLLNRAVFDRHTAKLQSAHGVVIVFDLDGFKRINDRFGHRGGDTCLEIIGGLIKDVFHRLGRCYRIGGDEFCVISDTTDEEALKAALLLFDQAVDTARIQHESSCTLPTVSTGYAIFTGPANMFDAAVRQADADMYASKKK